MKFNSTLLGIVVLAAVGVAVFWTRVKAPPPSVTQLVSDSDRQASSDEATLPDVTLAAGSVDLEDVRITLSLTPQPPVAFAKIRVRVRVSSTAAADKLLTLEGGRVAFEMSMPMGDHRYSLVPGEEGWLEAAVVLPT